MMKLFDDIDRHDVDPAKYAEPVFTYLNRSARTVVESIRHTLKTWFSRYPLSERSDLRGRFRSTNDTNHRSAFFELFLHEILIQLGCRVRIHPSPSDDTTRRPDFLVESPSGKHFYMEAVLATEESDTDVAARARMNVVYDALDRLVSPDFFIGMTLEGTPETPPPARRIRSFLAKRIAQLNPDDVTELYKSGGLEALPKWHYEYEGWKIDFYPIPKKPDARGKAGVRPIGLQFHGFRLVDTRVAIREAVVAKAGRYGDFDLPYVIAVNAFSQFGINQIDVMDALFGKEQWTVQITQSGPAETEMTRKPDGAWTSKSGPRYTRVSAVLLASTVLPWNVPRAPICLYHNPWAKRPYISELTRFPQAIPQQEGHMEWCDGETIGHILDLPFGWPE